MDYNGTDFYCDVALKDTSKLNREYESDKVIAYHHTDPSWSIHIVVLPKAHISSFASLEITNVVLVNELLEVLQSTAVKVEEHYGAARIITNLGAYQDSKHFHFHVVSGKRIR